VIRAAAALDPPVPRLLSAMGERPAGEAPTLVLGGGCAAGALDHSLREAPDARLLVLSALGAHPDARAPRLKALWDLEEQARGAGRPVLTLRLAPIVGPQSPLWLRLRSRPRLPGRPKSMTRSGIFSPPSNPELRGNLIETCNGGLASA